MTEATVTRKRQKRAKGESPTEETSRKTIDIEDIADDGKVLMRISKTKTIGQALPYGQFKISDSTTVELCCNQDMETAKKANVLCRKLVKKFMKVDLEKSDELFEEKAQEMLEDLE